MAEKGSNLSGRMVMVNVKPSGSGLARAELAMAVLLHEKALIVRVAHPEPFRPGRLAGAHLLSHRQHRLH